MLLLNIIILCLITLMAIVVAAFFYLRMKRSDAALDDMNHRLSGQGGQEKTLFTKEELEAQREDARLEGEDLREQEIKDSIQGSFDAGHSTLSMLRELFPEDIVVGNQGRYYFYPILSDIPANTFTSGDFVLDDDGILVYQGTSPDVELLQGIQVGVDSGDIDWNVVAEESIDYAMICVGGRNADGDLERDTTFIRNMTDVQQTALSVGITYNMAAVSPEEAQEDAEWLVDTLQPYETAIDSYVAVVIQMPAEGDRMSGVSSDTVTSNIQIICNTLKLAGYRPMVCGTLTALMLQTEFDELGDFTIGISNSGASLYFPYSLALWRYASEVSLDGVENTVARSVLITQPE